MSYLLSMFFKQNCIVLHVDMWDKYECDNDENNNFENVLLGIQIGSQLLYIIYIYTEMIASEIANYIP